MTKHRKACATLAVGSLLAGAGAIAIGLADAGAASAATVPVSQTFTYSCALATGATDIQVTVSADVPDSVTTGAPIHVANFQSTAVVPGSVASLLSGVLGIASVEGPVSVTNEITDNGVPHESTFDATVPNTPVPSDGSDLTTVASGTVPDYTTTGAGSVVLGAGPFTAMLHGLAADGTNAGHDDLLTFTCTPPSDATLATVTVADAMSLAVSGPSSVNYGGTAKLSTVLRDTTTNKPFGANVVLQRRANSSKPFTNVATVRTSSTGAASRNVTMTANAQFRWSYAGNATHKARTSPVKSVSVAQVIAIHRTRSSVRHGVAFKIWGTAKPAGRGQTVRLQHLVGRAWRNGPTATLKRQKLPNGSTTTGYVFTVKETRRGTYRFRVHKAATSTLTAGTSAVVAVRVT